MNQIRIQIHGEDYVIESEKHSEKEIRACLEMYAKFIENYYVRVDGDMVDCLSDLLPNGMDFDKYKNNVEFRF